MLAAVAAAAALSAVTISSDQTSTPASVRGAAASQARSTQGMTAVRDPETGQLREPTAEELIELQSQTSQSADAPEPIVSATGFDGLKLGDNQMTFTVATRRADGTVNVEHAAGRKDAERQVREGAVPRGLVAGKERLLER